MRRPQDHKPKNGLPPGVNRQQAEAMADEANDWYAGLASLMPTAVRFNLRTVTVAVKTPDGAEQRDVVRLTAYTPCGAFVLHLPAEIAESLAEGLKDHALRARTGLIVAP